ncbi:hypothetical protein [Caulobacter phage DCM]|uniref:Uncharacterized protein n=2 Tax=Autonotataviridae TaxID=3424634 RepID=A0AAF0B9T5_9CAUD|nr:hypothetical protein [Caulobacter phage DCM]WCA46296.1 hypothetical protein [Caulobacter phage ERS]WCD56128.1 hypothetical protein [Caulobacter phage BL199]
MIAPKFAHERLVDKAVHEKKLGELAKQRGGHLDALSELEEITRAAAPLPISYDVSRTQAPYFSEFTYTELLGEGLYLQPQSSEASARLAVMAMEQCSTPLVVPEPKDKYTLVQEEVSCKAVAFLPGSNLLREFVSQEALSRAMWEDDELVLKPHPLTTAAEVSALAAEFGYHRVLGSGVSGVQALKAAQRVYCLSTTELGLYAVSMGKPIKNLGNFWVEGQGAYASIYRLLWGHSTAEAKERLSRVLGSTLGGYIPKGSTLRDVQDYFNNAMSLRENLKPLIPTRKK